MINFRSERYVNGPSQHVVLVGGFAASDWLFKKIEEELAPHQFNVIRPESHVWVLSPSP